MGLAYLYALGLLLLIPLLMGWEAFGFWGLGVGSVLAWIIIAIAKSIENAKQSDEEILGTYVTAARYYESWTEKIKHEDKEKGEVAYEEVEHGPVWEITVAEGDTLWIDDEAYAKYVALFGNETQEIANHDWEAEGEVIDPGYCYTTVWPGTFETACYEYVYRSYKNPTLGTANVYTSEKLDSATLQTHQLESYTTSSLYGHLTGDDVSALSRALCDYNCWFREQNIKLNFILLENEPSSHAMFWQQHWHNGKRNTLNVVIGVDAAHQIKWAHVFGWQNEAACIKLRDFITGQKALSDITPRMKQLGELIKGNYHLPDFEQYNFIQHPFPLQGTLIALTIFLGIFCALFGRPVQLNARAQLHLDQREYQQAKVDFENYLSTHPTSVAALNNLGILYTRDKQYEQAEVMFSRALERAGLDQAYIYSNRALYYQEMQQYKKAITDAQQAIMQNEYATKPYCALYHLYQTVGYKKLMRQLEHQYEQSRSNSLVEDCRYYSDQFTFLYEDVDVMEGRGITRLLNKFFQ